MNHTDAINRIALTCAYCVQEATAASLAIRVAKHLGISAALAMQVTARVLAEDMEIRSASNAQRRNGRSTLRLTAKALRALADQPSDELPPPAGELSPDLRALA